MGLFSRVFGRREAKTKAESQYNPTTRSKQLANFSPSYLDNLDYKAGWDVKAAQSAGLGLATENPIGSGMIQTMTDGAIGAGLVLESSVNAELAGVSSDKASAFQRRIEALWEVYSQSPEMCDFHGHLTLGGIQRMAFATALYGGDVLVRIAIADAGGIYLPRIQLIPPHLVSSPDNMDTDSITAGVERDAQGRDIAYHVAEFKHGEAMASSWKRCPRHSSRGRTQFILFKLNEMVPGSARGRSIFNAVKSLIVQADRYTEAETVKAIVQSCITLFIEKDKDTIENVDGGGGISAIKESQVRDSLNGVHGDDSPITMAPGAGYELAPGERAHLAESQSPVAQFMSFMEMLLKMIGMAASIPYEVLLKSFNASYSASQASIQEAARVWKLRQTELSSEFLQEIYSQFIYCMAKQRKVSCPGYFSSPFVRKAWEGATWHGPAVIHINPILSVKAAREAIAAGLSTKEIEAQRLYGNKWESVAHHQAEENRLERELGLDTGTEKGSAGKERNNEKKE